MKRCHPDQLFLPLPFRVTVTCGKARPDDPGHHLRRKPSGLFQLRLTIDRGPKFVGHRIVVGLNTRDPQEAARRRDVVMEALRKAKLVVES